MLIGGAEGIALLLRRRAATILAAHATVMDGAVVAALLVFALGTMAGIRAQLDGHLSEGGTYVALAFASNIGLQATGAMVLPGSIRQRFTVGLVLGNRNVGLVWSTLGAAVTPQMALYFAAAQLPIYMLPRLRQL